MATIIQNGNGSKNDGNATATPSTCGASNGNTTNHNNGSSFVHPRDALVEVMSRMYSRHLTTSSGGNASIRDVEGTIWMTPKGNDKGALTRDEIAYASSTGTTSTSNDDGTATKNNNKADYQWHGNFPPSSEWPFHTRVYKARPDVRAVLHAHSQTLVAFSVAKQLPNTLSLSQAAFLCGTVGLAPYAMPGTDTLADRIEKAIVQHDCVIMENHGVVVVAANMTEAYQKFEALEFCARAEIRARILGGTRLYLTPQDMERQAAVTAHQTTTALCKANDGGRPMITPKECDLRAKLVKYVRRAYEQGLIHSTSGAFSAKLTPTSFLITPSGVDRRSIRPHDLVLVHFTSMAHAQACREAAFYSGESSSVLPSRAWPVHNALYQRFVDCESILHAHPFHITAFCMTSTPFASNVIPESYIVLRNVASTTFRKSLDHEQVARCFEKHDHNHNNNDSSSGNGGSNNSSSASSCNVMLVQNDGVMIKGKSLEQVFDRLEVLEATANVVLECMSLGTLNLMTTKQTDQIDREWFHEEPSSKRRKTTSTTNHGGGISLPPDVTEYFGTKGW